MQQDRLIISLALASLLPLGAATAQAQGHYEATANPTMKVTRPEKTVEASAEYEIAIKKTLEVNTSKCEANLKIKYSQRNEKAQVSTTLNNTQCGASQGAYTVRLQYRDESGEVKTLDYPETWQRKDAQPVIDTRQYFLGDNADLLRVKTRGLSCVCDEQGTDNP